jgi:hypothetical protein
MYKGGVSGGIFDRLGLSPLTTFFSISFANLMSPKGILRNSSSLKLLLSFILHSKEYQRIIPKE